MVTLPEGLVIYIKILLVTQFIFGAAVIYREEPLKMDECSQEMFSLFLECFQANMEKAAFVTIMVMIVIFSAVCGIALWWCTRKRFRFTKKQVA